MGFKLYVLGLLVLVAFDHVFGARRNVRAFQPRVLTQEPQRVDDQFREQWKPIKTPHKVHSQRPKFTLRTLNLAPSSSLKLVNVFRYRRQNVNSSDLQPTSIPYMSTKDAEDILHFSLKLMTGLYCFCSILFSLIVCLE